MYRHDSIRLRWGLIICLIKFDIIDDIFSRFILQTVVYIQQME